MTRQSFQEFKDSVFGENGPDPDLLIRLAPFLSEPFLSRAISIAYAIQDPLKRSYILQALALSEQLSETKKKELISAALDAAKKIISKPKKVQALEKLMPLVSDEDLDSIKAQLTEVKENEAREEVKRREEEMKRRDELENMMRREEEMRRREEIRSPKEWSTGFKEDEMRRREKEEYKNIRYRINDYMERLGGEEMRSRIEHEEMRRQEEEMRSREEEIASMSWDERDDLVRETLARLQTRVVNTGFAPSHQADKPVNPTEPLRLGQLYYFWLEIGTPTLHSIENVIRSLPEKLPQNAQLKVAIFPFKDEIQIIAGADVGELQLQSDGTALVICQPESQPNNTTLNSGILNRRLLFPVKTPEREGTFRLRCNIYYKQILIQSRLISAVVSRHGKPTTKVLQSTVDYALSHTLWPDHLKSLDSHRLSILLNNNGDDTHTLTLMIDGKNKPYHAWIPATELMTLTENARKVLWKVSWGEENPWAEEKNYYHYKDENCNLQRLKEDLTSLAIRGYILYDAIIDKFTHSRNESENLATLMHNLNPGMVQIAIINSPTQILPAALFYDYPLNTQDFSPDAYKLCEAFESALQSNVPLEESPCFKGACPHSKRNEQDEPDGYICPSGFWGYRHSLGFPVSVANGMDVPPEIVLNGDLQIVVGVATNLNLLNAHMTKLKDIKHPIGFHYSANRNEIINQLKNLKSHLVYFYCHGGLTPITNVPYLQVGSSDYIEGSNLRAYHIIWDEPHPLVFINGCHTTALNPEKAINLVQDFVNTGGVGVIGTETTIFESLACNFAEACLKYFFADGKPIGDAVRMARLKLLKEGNPLGLIYTPFVHPSLHIKE